MKTTPTPQDCTCQQPLTAICPYHEWLAKQNTNADPAPAARPELCEHALLPEWCEICIKREKP